MDIINVIVTDTYDGSVLSIESFPIHEEQLRDDVVEQAEKEFCRRLPKEWTDFDYDVALEDGSVEVTEERALVSIVWSYN